MYLYVYVFIHICIYIYKYTFHVYQYMHVNMCIYYVRRNDCKVWYCDLQNNCKFDRPFKNDWMRAISIQDLFFIQLRKQGLKKRAQNRFATGGQICNYFASRSNSLASLVVHPKACVSIYACKYVYILCPQKWMQSVIILWLLWLCIQKRWIYGFVSLHVNT